MVGYSVVQEPVVGERGLMFGGAFSGCSATWDHGVGDQLSSDGQ